MGDRIHVHQDSLFRRLVAGFPHDASGYPICYKDLFILYFAMVLVICVCVNIISLKCEF